MNIGKSSVIGATKITPLLARYIDDPSHSSSFIQSFFLPMECSPWRSDD